MEIKNILVPVDGSEGSDRAITHAISLAEACNAKLNFLYQPPLRFDAIQVSDQEHFEHL